MPLSRLSLALLLAALFSAAGCGKDKPSHGLSTEPLKNQPVGEPIHPGYAIRDGETYTATVEMVMRVDQTSVRAGRDAPPIHREGRAVLELVWTLHRPAADAPITSSLTMHYLEAEGADAEAYLKRDAIRGTLRHDETGRVLPHSLQIYGGTTQEKLQAQHRTVSLLLAGFGGAYPWIPPRDIRVGEAWQLASFLKPRAIENVRRYARETGVETPEPTFEGTGRLERVVVEDGERWLDVKIDALIDISGRVAKGGERGWLAIGDRTTGTASISATRGVPRRFEVTHTRRSEDRAGSDRTEVRVRSTVRGTVVRTLPAK